MPLPCCVQSENENPRAFLSGTKKDALHVVMPDFPQVQSFAGMIPQFENMLNCKVIPQFFPLKEYLQQIKMKTSTADVFIVDRPWIYNFADNNLLADISDYIFVSGFAKEKYLVNSLKSMCYFKGKYLGLPFLSLPQIMYYRKDLFTSPAICRNYERLYQSNLLPPRTWAEYNRIAAFFTRKSNHDSPLEYGTSFAAAFSACFSSEFYVRLREHGGKVFDSSFNVTLDSEKCLSAYKLIKETTQFCPDDYLAKDNSGAMDDFLVGKTAMLITFRLPIGSDHLEKAIGSNRIGFAQVPGRRPNSRRVEYVYIGRFKKKRPGVFLY